jgi:hypothetical protein
VGLGSVRSTAHWEGVGETGSAEGWWSRHEVVGCRGAAAGARGIGRRGSVAGAPRSSGTGGWGVEVVRRRGASAGAMGCWGAARSGQARSFRWAPRSNGWGTGSLGPVAAAWMGGIGVLAAVCVCRQCMRQFFFEVSVWVTTGQREKETSSF